MTEDTGFLLIGWGIVAVVAIISGALGGAGAWYVVFK
jgi:Tfp pilus assembly major pilin PilA